ncbi:hypothetical protein BDZ45DRAFT_687827 [Acephala macrosclerotiorum]|nr:hypothetical protein BDZ45DRAFT_687827 [Acephala macrosclerotiorum]
MAQSAQVESSDNFITKNYPGRHETDESGYNSQATTTERSPSWDLKYISEATGREDGSFLQPDPRQEFEKQDVLPDVPPLGLVSATCDDNAWIQRNVGNQTSNPSGLLSASLWQNLSLPNQLCLPPLDTTTNFIHDPLSTATNFLEPYLSYGSALGLENGVLFSQPSANGNVKQIGDLADSVPSPSERATAVAFVSTWLTRSPGLWPSPEIIAALAISAGLVSGIIQNAFAEILHGNAAKFIHNEPDSRCKRSSSTVLEAESYTSPWDENADSILKEASAWVRKHKKKCRPFKKTSMPQSDGLLRQYKCSFGCGWTFPCKDSWKQHEELIYPQEAWICNLDTTVLISGTIRCAYCGMPNPAMDHVEKDHTKSHKSGSCSQRPFGRGRVFYPKEAIVSHFRKVHKNIPYANFLSQYHFFVQPDFDRSCSLCPSYRFRDWQDRIAHIAVHFEENAKDLRNGLEAPSTNSVPDSTNKIISSHCTDKEALPTLGLNVPCVAEPKIPDHSTSHRQYLDRIMCSRDLSPEITEFQRRSCPVCENQFEDRGAMLQHVSTCPKLSGGSYRCIHCNERGTIGHHLDRCNSMHVNDSEANSRPSDPVPSNLPSKQEPSSARLDPGPRAQTNPVAATMDLGSILGSTKVDNHEANSMLFDQALANLLSENKASSVARLEVRSEPGPTVGDASILGSTEADEEVATSDIIDIRSHRRSSPDLSFNSSAPLGPRSLPNTDSILNTRRPRHPMFREAYKCRFGPCTFQPTGKRAYHKRILQRHQERCFYSPLPRDKKPCKCTFPGCNKKFSRSDNLNAHRKASGHMVQRTFGQDPSEDLGEEAVKRPRLPI